MKTPASLELSGHSSGIINPESQFTYISFSNEGSTDILDNLMQPRNEEGRNLLE